MEQVHVWAEHFEGFVLVGTLALDDGGQEWFAYDPSYLESRHPAAIYPVLPLKPGRFSQQQTRSAFASLGPEGPVGHDIRTALRAGRDTVTPVLARLNHETTGALTFTGTDEQPYFEDSSDTLLIAANLEAFARNPQQTAFEALLESRLSLNGAVSKMGVIERDGSFYLPRGLEPSTFILKAGTPALPHQMLNEALCMRCAAACGFDDAAQTNLISIDGCDHILVTKRFDRLHTPDRPYGLPKVMRLHQADFCQILGISVDALKYTPSDELIEGYTTSVARAVSRESSQRYGDRSYIFDIQVFDYLVGNCDNHLKNLSLTWSSDWEQKSVSPIYDVTCTTIYSELSRDMGMGIGLHRSIDHIEVADFPLMAEQLGVSWRQVRDGIAQMAESLVPALMDCAHGLEEQGIPDALEMAEFLARDWRDRIEVAKRAALI